MAKTRFGYVGSGQIPGAIFGTRNQVSFGWRMRPGREAPVSSKWQNATHQPWNSVARPSREIIGFIDSWFQEAGAWQCAKTTLCLAKCVQTEKRGKKGPIARIVRSAYNYEVGVVPSRLPFSSIALLWTNKVNFRRRGFTHPQSSIMVRWMVRRERTLGETLASFTWRSSFSA